MDPNLALVLVGLLIGLSKGGIAGPAAGGIVLFLMTKTMTVAQAAGVTLPLLIFADLFAMQAYWKKWDMRYIRLLLPAALVGIAMGTLLLTSLPDDFLRKTLGLFSLVVIGYKLVSEALKTVEYSSKDWHGYLAGWTTGFASALANAGGPPANAYLLLQKLDPVPFSATLALFFFIVNVLKVPGFLYSQIIDFERLASIAWILPLIPLGVWAGRWIVTRIDRRPFEWLMLFALFWAALALIFG
jgi:uncharacterized membrane protein YfcA